MARLHRLSVSAERPQSARTGVWPCARCGIERTHERPRRALCADCRASDPWWKEIA